MIRKRIIWNKILYGINYSEKKDYSLNKENNNRNKYNHNFELSNYKESLFINNIDNNNDDISLLEKKSYDSFFNINQNFINSKNVENLGFFIQMEIIMKIRKIYLF